MVPFIIHPLYYNGTDYGKYMKTILTQFKESIPNKSQCRRHNFILLTVKQ